ncbi:MAG: thioredoxin family protein [Phycisphaerae bacterium]
MSEPADDSGKRPAKRASDYRVKLAFLAAAIAAGVAIYFYLQRGKMILRTWPDDLPKALQQARKEDRRLLLFFMSSPPGETTKQMAATTLKKPHNRKAIAEGNFIAVKVVVDTSLKSDVARRHKIGTLPTMLILSPAGEELNRREGMIGEVQFREGFLSCKQVVKPPQ